MFEVNYNLLLMSGATIFGILLVILLVQFFLLRAKVNRLSKKYHYFMGGHDGVSIERQLSAEVKQLRNLVSTSEGMLHQQELLANMQLESFQRMGLVNYDAFDMTGDKLSFSLTLLNGRNDGFVFSCLTGSGASRIYAKKIVAGDYKGVLSSEEAESINMALNTQMPNVVVEAQEQVARLLQARKEMEESVTVKSPKKRRIVKKVKEEPKKNSSQGMHRESKISSSGYSKKEIRTRNEALVSSRVGQTINEPLGNATEADLSIFSSRNSGRSTRRGQFKVNHHEERNK